MENKEWVPLHSHSHYSLLDSISKADQTAKRCSDLGYKVCSLTDHGTISGVPSHFKAMEKKGIKPIAGAEFYLCKETAKKQDKENGSLKHLCVLAKDAEGWKRLVQAISASNHPDHFYRKPRLSLEELASFSSGHWVVFSGHPGSDLGDVLWKDHKQAYSARTMEHAREWVDPGRSGELIDLAGKYQDLFGKENFFLEIQLIDQENLPASAVIGSALRYLGKKLDIPCVATADSHYPSSEDAADQRVLLATNLRMTLKEIRRKMVEQEDVGLGAFFRSNRYHIPSLEELTPLHTEEELANSVRIAEMCGMYDIFSPPRLPKFDCPDGMNADQYLRHLCREGWRKKISPTIPRHEQDKYKDRINQELDVICGAGLSAYFLIVWDYCNWARNQGMLLGRGRGSAGGCLISYLVGITAVDPIQYGLLFSRFYNSGRNSPGRISLPDIDCDFPKSRREEVIQYIRRKHGEAYVSQMVTFGRLQGRSALKAVLRAHEACSFEQMNAITKFVPDEARIADELQNMKELGIQPSILRWALDHNREELSPWCELKEDGSLEGPMAHHFAQAMRLEGVKCNQGRHAAGLIISTTPLAEVCPMVRAKNTKELVTGFEMGEMEAMGHVKMDILGIKTLDVLMATRKFLRGESVLPGSNDDCVAEEEAGDLDDAGVTSGD